MECLNKFHKNLFKHSISFNTTFTYSQTLFCPQECHGSTA